MNRRSFLKSCGVGVVAPLALVGKVEAKPEMVEVVEVFQKGFPVSAMCFWDADGKMVPFQRGDILTFPCGTVMEVKNPISIMPWMTKPGKSYGS